MRSKRCDCENKSAYAEKIKEQGLRSPEGFTLVEILIAVVIIAVIAAFVMIRMPHLLNQARRTEALESLGVIRSAQFQYHQFAGRFALAEDHPAIQSLL